MKPQLIRKVYFYSDGTYTEENFEIDTISESSEKINEILSNPAISRRIAYNAAVFLTCVELYPSDKVNFLKNAVNIISENAKVANATVYDKMYRQLDLKSSGYRKIITNALNGKPTEFKKQLLNHVGSNPKDEDEAIINEIL